MCRPLRQTPDGYRLPAERLRAVPHDISRPALDQEIQPDLEEHRLRGVGLGQGQGRHRGADLHLHDGTQPRHGPEELRRHRETDDSDRRGTRRRHQ